MTLASILFLLGRILFGGYFISNGINHLKKHKGMTEYARSKGVPSPLAGVLFTGLLMLVGGLGIFTGIQMIVSLWLIIVFLVPTTFVMHNYWKEKDAVLRMNEKMAFLKNMALIGATLIMLAMLYMMF